MKTLLALLAFTFTAQAQLVMDMVGGQDLSVGPGTAAFSFTATAPITLRSLGVWDSDTLTPGLYNAHTIGLWDADTHALLASATVPAQGATAVGEFWYVALAAPITLATGHSYVLGATYLDSDFDAAKGNVTSVVTDSRITLGDALLSTGTGFEFPDLNVSGANLGFFGANGLETAVPEPSELCIATGLSLAAFALQRRRRRRIVRVNDEINRRLEWNKHYEQKGLKPPYGKRQLKASAIRILILISLPSMLASEPTVRSVLDAKPTERQRLIDAIAKKRPALAPANRPPVTPGTDKGNRPVVPPGIVRKYATP